MFKDEKVVEIKTCKSCSAKFEITDKDLEFYEKVSPTFGGKKYLIPSPTLCPECRQQRRLVWRNERNLYKRNCDASGKPIISMYNPKSKYKVYNQEFWWSDKWEAKNYSKDFDFSRTFFEQFNDLKNKVPHNSLINNFRTNENSDYGNFSGNNKNCYLIFEAGSLENCYYSEGSRKSTNIVDSYGATFCENGYNLIDCFNCFNCFNLKDCSDCNNCSYLLNCKNCSECFMSNNLVGKKYYFYNKEYSKLEYYEKINNIKLKDLKKDYLNLLSNSIVPSMHGFGNENVFGDYIYNSKNSFFCFDSKNLDSCKFCSIMASSKMISYNCYDYDYFGSTISGYEIVTVGGESTNILFSNNTWDNANNIIYCSDCTGSKNCFGCFGITYKEYYILNKEYSKEEYEILVPKIIEHMKKTGEWGEFFPASFSPFGYNETVANEYFPLSKDEALKRGFNWSDYVAPFPKVDKIIKAGMLPEDISKVPDDILNWAIECEISGKPFRIVKAELEFYRKHLLPIPKRHPDRRHFDRLDLRNPRKIFDRNCDKCGTGIKTTYATDRKEIVYCESCFEKEVY